MPDAIEYLPFDQRIERLKEIADSIVDLLKRTGPQELTAFLQSVAQEFRLAMSQVKYGLTYAKSTGAVSVDEHAMVALAAA
jgi:hypothetical protein